MMDISLSRILTLVCLMVPLNSLNAELSRRASQDKSTEASSKVLTKNTKQLSEVVEALSARGYDINSANATPSQINTAVRYFQTDNGIPVTGQLDSATLNALGIIHREEFDRQPASTIDQTD